MPRRYQVSYSEKRISINPFERIKAIGGRNPDGTRWRMNVNDVISNIEKGGMRFIVSNHTSKAEVVVEKSPMGWKYLKTTKDSTVPSTLLHLPDSL